MQLKLAFSLTLLAASCSSVPCAGARPPLETSSATVGAPSAARWEHGVTLAWNQRYADSQWDPAADYRGGSLEYSGLVRDGNGQGTGLEVSFGRAESNENSHPFFARPSTWRRWTDYSVGVRHERPLGSGRLLLSGGASYVQVDLSQQSLFAPVRIELDSLGAYVRTGYIQPLSTHLDLVVTVRYRSGKNDSYLSREADLDHAGFDVGLTWRF